MEEFRDSMHSFLEIVKVNRSTIIKFADHLREPENDEALESFFSATYIQWKQMGGFAMLPLKFLNPPLYKQLIILDQLFQEFDEQPGSPLALD